MSDEKKAKSEHYSECKSFSVRLVMMLQAHYGEAIGPTRLQREFNNQYTGSPVTVHAARKWILGETIPRQNKLKVLAQILLVTPEWLRFGGGAQSDGCPARVVPTLNPWNDKFIQQIGLLGESDTVLLKDFVDMLRNRMPKG